MNMKNRLCVICEDEGVLGRNHFVSENKPCKHCGNTDEKIHFKKNKDE
jgi:hypothetical protein